MEDGKGPLEGESRGAFLADFRAALQNPAYFGPSGIVQRSIGTVDLSAVNAASLSGINMFIAPWMADIDFNAAQVSVITGFFFGGGDLFLLQDDPDHDVIGQALGLSTFPSTGAVSNGGAPLYVGPFGTASNVTQDYRVGRLEEAVVVSLGGTVAGRNASGQVTSAYWRAGDFAPGAGALFINADVDMIATTTACGRTVCGATYAPLNNNGIFALNTFAFIQNAGGTPPPIPEPATARSSPWGCLRWLWACADGAVSAEEWPHCPLRVGRPVGSGRRRRAGGEARAPAPARCRGRHADCRKLDHFRRQAWVISAALPSGYWHW